ncbi:MAG: TonB-dependent receptor [Dokdonella sp.]
MIKKSLLRKTVLASLISAAITSIAVLPEAGWAQSAAATLKGRAPANSDIVATNVANGSARRTKASADGSYALVGLQPGTYRVEANGASPQTVTLSVASTATLDLAAGGAAEAPAPLTTTTLEGVTVTAQNLVEVKTSEVGNTISQRQIQTIPQATRNFLEFADTVPGMVFTTDPSGHTKLTSGGQNANAVNVYIDGVGQKNYVKEGGVSGQFNSQGNPFPQLGIGEYKVITSNYKAEYDQVSSAAVTAETKSGTNEFHGEVFDTYTDQDWRKKTPAEIASGTKIHSQEREYGAALGGPIIQDTLHFFLTYEAKQFDTPKTIVPGVATINDANGQPISVLDLLPANVSSQFGAGHLPFTERLFFGKLDWEFSDRDRVEVSARVRKEEQADNIGTSNAKSASTLVRNDDKRFDARWQHSADAWFNELLFTYQKNFNNPTSLNGGNALSYTTSVGSGDPLIVNAGAAGPLATQSKGQRGPGFQDNLTFNDLHWMGDHIVKMGIKYQDLKLVAQDAGLGNSQFFYDVTAEGTQDQPYSAFFTKSVPGLSPSAQSNDKQFGTYIQDDWAINDKLTLNLGVRWDYEQNSTYLDYVTPASVVAALNGPNTGGDNPPPGQTYAQALALGGVNINDYISTGNNRSAPKNEFQPRLGFSYDLNADQEHVIFGGAGRSYDRNLYDYLQLEQTKQSLQNFRVFFRDPATGLCHHDQTPCYDFNPAFLTDPGALQSLVAASNAGTEVDLINNNIKAPYSDQFSIGMRNQVGEWMTSAAVARIISKDGLVFTLGNRYPDGAFFVNGGQPWGHGVPGFGALIIGNNGIETRTNQLLLSADKTYTKDSGWGATLAYTYTNGSQNRDINEHYAFDEATIDQYRFITSNATAKHRLVASGSLDGPWGFVFSGKLTLATPIPHSQFACYNNGAFFPTGSHCTPYSATPDGHSLGFGGKIYGYRSLDLQATKNFDLSSGLSLYVRADFLNVFNFKNYADYSTQNSGVLNDSLTSYITNGNIVGYPRTIRLTGGFRF